MLVVMPKLCYNASLSKRSVMPDATCVNSFGTCMLLPLQKKIMYTCMYNANECQRIYAL